MTDFSGARVLVTHDWIIPWGGAERALLEIMAVVPQADLVVGVLNPRHRDRNDVTRRARETWLGRIPLARSHHRWFVPAHYAAFRSVDGRDYDFVISSSFGFSKAVRTAPGQPHLCYCYSPPRYVWDMSDSYQALAGGVRGGLLRVATPILQRLDRMSARGVTRFVGISRHIARRIQAAYGRDAGVIYPPVAPKPGVGGAERKRKAFLLSLGRLAAYKRVDLAILAAERLRVPLVVAGDGPERPKLERLAGAHTTFLGEVSEEQAGDLMEACAAFVFCAEEDFGIAPIEANAHGAPVVGYARGALPETMVAGVTAELFETQTPDAVASAIQRALARSWDAAAIRANATRFSGERFRSEFRSAIAATLSAASR